MKRNSVLIAVAAVLAAASPAKAEMNINFDGSMGPQSMHSIFAAGHNLVPASALQQAAPRASEAAPVLRGKAIDPATYKALTAYYAAQPRIKMLVSGYYLGKGDAAGAGHLAGRSVRVLASAGSVFVIENGQRERIADPALASAVKSLAFPSNGEKNVGAIIEVGSALIDIATNDDMWEDLGEGVSTISEAATEWYYTSGPGGGSRD